MVQPPPRPQPSITTIIYVVGEVVISILALIGCGLVLFYSSDQGVKLTAASVLSAVTVFWFQRRAAEQSTNNLATLANGKLTTLLNSQGQLQARQDALVSLVASMAARSGQQVIQPVDAPVTVETPPEGA